VFIFLQNLQLRFDRAETLISVLDACPQLAVISLFHLQYKDNRSVILSALSAHPSLQSVSYEGVPRAYS
jgi:hypothetical protein